MTDPGAAPPWSLFDFLRAQALVFEELRRIQHLVTERMLSAAPGQGEDPARGPEEEELTGVLRGLRSVLLQHPLASQAAFSALVAEGRRFAATPEGAEWKAALAGSDVVHKGRQVWEALSLGLVEEEPSTVVPSTYLEALFQATALPELEALLRRLRSTRAEEGHGAP
jgi:hypothetical protein